MRELSVSELYVGSTKTVLTARQVVIGTADTRPTDPTKDRRQLVTGHESMGYFAQRYQFRLIGAIIPLLASVPQAVSRIRAADDVRKRKRRRPRRGQRARRSQWFQQNHH